MTNQTEAKQVPAHVVAKIAKAIADGNWTVKTNMTSLATRRDATDYYTASIPGWTCKWEWHRGQTSEKRYYKAE